MVTKDFSKKTGRCRNCNCETPAVLHLNIAENGAESYTWVCSKCNLRNPFGGDYFIAKEKVLPHFTADQLAQLPVLMRPKEHRCARCGNRDCELHHWAPRAIFGKDECEQWPKDYLCKACHDEWHKKATPELVGQP